jgi:hypothetical protein
MVHLEHVDADELGHAERATVEARPRMTSCRAPSAIAFRTSSSRTRCAGPSRRLRDQAFAAARALLPAQDRIETDRPLRGSRGFAVGSENSRTLVNPASPSARKKATRVDVELLGRASRRKGSAAFDVR